MAKRKAARRGTSKTAAKRSAKKAAQPRSKRGPKNARKAAKPKATPAGRARTAKSAKKSTKAAPARGAKAAKPSRAATKTKTPAPRRPNLDRQRRTVAETERPSPTPPSSLNMDRSASSARSGRAEMAERLREHTSTGPALTGGDVDADWESAESVGDEAPGGDNPTPDQDVVDDIGKALGVQYDDDEELQGGDEIVERDRKRWELDPASSDDYDDRE